MAAQDKLVLACTYKWRQLTKMWLSTHGITLEPDRHKRHRFVLVVSVQCTDVHTTPVPFVWLSFSPTFSFSASHWIEQENQARSQVVEAGLMSYLSWALLA